ncbi:MAG: class I SAM-dependent methyltransferase [Planctomycetes bacterium]|nr:class I SAM-dependent methyltransferase [Planctomycetota bacterium]
MAAIEHTIHVENLPDPSPGSWHADAMGLSLMLPLDDAKPHRLHVDFLTGAMGYRRRHSGRNQAIARAIGLKKGRPLPTVWDLTAGLGRDSFVLAWLGCRVVAIERDPRVFALLEDGVRRALLDDECAQALQSNLSLHCADALQWLPNALEKPWPDESLRPAPPDVIYLDPMHPERRKSAQVRKEMRLFRNLVGADLDANHLLTAALATGAPRVVVKRPRQGETLGLEPSHQHIGKTTRFDVYLSSANH